MDVNDLLAQLRADREFMRDVADWQRAPVATPRYAPFPPPMDKRVVDVLRGRGIDALYTHQAEAIDAALNGENVVILANAAGGKSLCFQAPILHTLLNDPSARSLLLFPTKALAQDQLSHFRFWISDLGLDGSTTAKGPSTQNQQSKIVNAYDGDTPQAKRSEIRKDSRVIITNADMLHLGILPHHTRWSAFFKNLRYVVIDEMHSYRGIFGSHVANVIRRLRRLCAFYGSNPIFILATATIANPQQHAERLIEAPARLIDNDGSPHGERHIVLINPPITNADLGLRQSADFVVRDVATRLIEAGLQTICFARSRNSSEILLTYLRNAMQANSAITQLFTRHALPATAVSGYRGGYLPEERRAIEKGLRDGSLRGVVATNALELGIDIGALDACVMLGYPGSIASFWQQAGRAGRRQSASLTVMVATPDPLDQYLVTHPQYLFSQSPEHARIAPDNLGVLAAHVACAAFELPFNSGEKLGSATIEDLLDALTEEGVVHASGGVKGLPLFRESDASRLTDDESNVKRQASSVRYTWVGDTYPADRVSLRGAGDRISIMDEMGNLVGDTELVTAAARVHPGAIYLHQAGAFLITEMDWDLGRAIGRKVDSDYYTQASAVSEVVVLKEFEQKGEQKQPRSGEIEVTTTVGRFRQVQFNTHKVLGWGEVDLPAQHLLTVGYWFVIEPHIAKQLEKEGIIGLPNDYGPNWTKQRELARERDQYKCLVCGKPEGAGQQHHVHHRKPFRTFGYVRGENDNDLRANDLSNLMTVCPTCHAKIETAEQVNQALSSLCYLLGNLAPLFVMCDSSDIAATFDTASPHTRQPTITLYEMIPGGTGLTDELIVHHAELLRMAKERIAECPCEQGCPACVGPIDEARGRNVKRDVTRLIDLIQRG